MTSGENRDVASGENDEEAAWRDLVAHYDAPASTGGDSPWPEREELTGPGGAGAADGGVPELRGRFPGAAGPAAAGTGSGTSASSLEAEDDPDGDHYIPPPPPPLPRLDALAKGAWAGLFGGPAYLLIAAAAGWTIPGLAALCAIAAFVGGFAILVLRMGDDPRRGSGPDDGAVV